MGVCRTGPVENNLRHSWVSCHVIATKLYYSLFFAVKNIIIALFVN